MASSTSHKTMFVLPKDFIVFFILNAGTHHMISLQCCLSLDAIP